MLDQGMPPSGPLSASERAAIQAWTDAGAPENDIVTASPQPSATPTPTPSSSPSAVNYATMNAQIFQPHCVGCHGSSGGVNLGSYANVIKYLSRVGSAALTNQSMPPSGPLSAANQALLQQWISAGAPQ